jgi:predicted trehalose synthase
MTEPQLIQWLPLMLGGVGLASAVITAAIAAVSKKWRTPADDREDRKIGIEADEMLVQRFTKLLDEQGKRIDGLVAEVKEVRALAEKAANVNRILTDWIYAAVRVVRELGGIHLLPPPPEGVIIHDHPLNITRQEAKP